MYRRINVPARSRKAVLLLAGLALAACNDITAPGGGLPGTRVLERPAFSAWRWLPSGQELLYSTPYGQSGASLRLEAVALNGTRRTVVDAPSNGDRIFGNGFGVGSHVYVLMWPLFSDVPSLYRAPLDGSAPPEKVVDTAALNVTVSPDERTLAWAESDHSGLSWTLVTMDIASGTRRVYPLQRPASRVVWSPTSRGVVVDVGNAWSASGTPFQSIDLESGAVRLWLAPSDEVRNESMPAYRWEGDTPFLYTIAQSPYQALPQALVRYSIATGVGDTLALLPSDGIVLGWSPDFETAFIATAECLQVSSGLFGGGDCLRWSSSVYRYAWRSGARADLVRNEGPVAIGGQLSPTGDWLAYYYSACGFDCNTGADGVYVMSTR